jgi:hypothetical protein
MLPKVGNKRVVFRLLQLRSNMSSERPVLEADSILAGFTPILQAGMGRYNPVSVVFLAMSYLKWRVRR